MKMNDNITLVLHHGGRFTPRGSDGKVEYIGREFDVWEDISADCLNAFILYDLVKACKKYNNIGECFWLIDKDLDFNHGLRSCTTDGDILHLVRDAFENENEINVYFHHEVDPILEEVPQMLYLKCDPIPKAVENEDDLDDVRVADHEEDEQALNEAKEAAAHVQQDPVEINLSQPHLSQDSDMELMVPATIVPPIARNKLTITRAKQMKNNLLGFLLVLAVRIAARLPWWHCRMKLPENAQQLPLADMEKSTWETNSFINPNLFGEEEEATLREREFIDADLSATLDSLRGTELPPIHLTNAVT
ncbi:hypothetical protein HKD37_19G053971 [Glycine soja]